MTLFRINVVFHKFLVPECYETLSEKDKEDHIRFIAVNGKIEKRVPPELSPLVIHESALPWYNPFMQHNRFCESSAFFHAWRNPQVFLDQAYIGFVQYDMIVKKEALEFLQQNISAAEAEGKKPVFAHYYAEARPHLYQVISLSAWDSLIQVYNMLHNTKHNILSVIDVEIPLYHTYVIHKELFHRMMTFAEVAVPRLFGLIHYDTRHMPFMLERMHGVFLALQRMDGQTGEWLPLPGIIHEDRLKDSWNSAS
jgi:Fe-S cluster biosynthesis and repair protein YggX